MEAEERLGQLDFLIDRITELQKRATDLQGRLREANQRNFDNNIADKARFELKLSAEAFYYFAARLMKILQRFPHLKNFDPPGVRNVRNHLIEHSDKACSGVTQQNWSFGGEAGPAFKNIRRPNQERVPIDRGLFINAAEFRDNLQRKLMVAIESIPPGT
jgi:hypothetical protein